MCGIAGIINQNIDEKEKVIRGMVGKIAHRGPDDGGFYVDKNVGLGMRRLAIIDLSTGRQPITSLDDKLIIVFNGEIYNYKELREELVVRHYKFKTQTDTEVILHLYEEFGAKMLTKLRGMFTICIYNTETKEIFLARDFFGIKPLYYLTEGERIVAFSSEIKSFYAIPNFLPTVNDSAVVNYLSYQYNPLLETFFNGVYKLPPAHYMKINIETGETLIKKYWSFEFDQNQELSKVPFDTKDEKEVARTVLDTMRDSVRHHMIADVPVGAFLSGGIDSSIIATLMQEIRGDKRVRTFTVGFDGLTEAKEAVETASFLGTDHSELRITKEEYFSVLQKAVYHFDEPVGDPSAIGLYFLAEEASKHVKVVLSGEGADELFGGYNIYFAPIAKAKLGWVPKQILELLLNLPFAYFGKNYLRRVSQKLSEWYIGNASIFSETDIKKLWTAKSEKMLSLNPLYKHVANLSESVQMQYIDINTWLVGDILAKADKMTMAHSLELRVPFLDMEVANLARVLPDRLKWHKGVTKYILREAFKKVIPESVRNRRKLGFPIPIRNWFTKDSREQYIKILTNPYIKSKMNMEYIEQLINQHTSKKHDNSRKIYILLMLSLWYDEFIK